MLVAQGAFCAAASVTANSYAKSVALSAWVRLGGRVNCTGVPVDDSAFEPLADRLLLAYPSSKGAPFYHVHFLPLLYAPICVLEVGTHNHPEELGLCSVLGIA